MTSNHRWKWIFLLALLYVIIMLLVQTDVRSGLFTARNTGTWSLSNESALKTILIWNSGHRIETAIFGTGHQAFLQHHCPVSNCTIHTTRNILPEESYDAILFHMHELHFSTRPSFQRSPHQRFVFLTQESPLTMPINVQDFVHFFNWTMTYKRNSDIQLLYGRIHAKDSAPRSEEQVQEMIQQTHQSPHNYASNKTSVVAWMVSHCETKGKRESYVEELQKYMHVDVYGKCGSLTCAYNETHWLSDPSCYEMMERKYKFYLSFENSICQDYVTEKFFTVLQYNLVPVVLGGSDYRAIAPRHSYIDAMRFTPRQLADYLHLLNTNDTLYNEYFWWKKHYIVESGVEQMARNAFCDLCAKLHQDSQPKSYSELTTEWDQIYQCKSLRLAQMKYKAII